MPVFVKDHKRTGRWWYARFRVNKKGEPEDRRSERAGRTREAAVKLLHKRQGEVVNGTYVDPRKPDPQRLTFGEFADRFLEEYAATRKSDYYAQQLRAAIEATPETKAKTAGPIRRHFGEKLLREIEAGDLDRYRMTCLIDDKVGPSTTRKRLLILGTVFKMARRWGVLDVNPAADLEKPSEPHHKVRFLSHEEWTRLLEVASPALRPFLRLAVSTGMRLKELTGLRWEDVDVASEFLHVCEDSKTGTRPIPFLLEADAVIREQTERRKTIGRDVGKLSPWVFTDAEGETFHTPKARHRITRTVTATMKAAKIEGASMHTLRHTAITWWLQNGMPLYVAQKLAGHSTPAMTQRYAHASREDLRGVADRYNAAMRGSGSPSATQPQPIHHDAPAPRESGTLSATSLSSGG